ncbi:MAG: hypothetical protein R2685_15295 [Candidatus Nitrosocosmicus sp.]|nr:hypothetical protein [Candidatus Nitrosocosmicus sp.]
MSDTKFQIVPTTEIFNGKTYSDWIPHWCNWFYMENPDQYNNEPWNNVKFLRSIPSPSYLKSLVAPGERLSYENSAMYRNIPNVMVGKDQLVMYDDQAIFFPAILAIWINKSNRSFAYMENWVKTQNFNSDDPPLAHQITIDGLPILSTDKIKTHKVDTNGTFRISIPDSQYGSSLKDFVLQHSPGWYDAYCQGYFFMLTGFQVRETPYKIFLKARGNPYDVGEYYSSFLYEVRVIPRELRTAPPRSGKFPERILSSFREAIREKKEDNANTFNSDDLLDIVNTSETADISSLTTSNGDSNAIKILILGRLKNDIKNNSQLDPTESDRLLSMITAQENGISNPATIKTQTPDRQDVSKASQMLKAIISRKDTIQNEELKIYVENLFAKE